MEIDGKANNNHLFFESKVNEGKHFEHITNFEKLL